MVKTSLGYISYIKSIWKTLNNVLPIPILAFTSHVISPNILVTSLNLLIKTLMP